MGTRKDSRALSTYKQAVLALRWLFDDTRLTPAGPRQRHRVVDRLRLPRRGHHRARRAASRRCTGRCWPPRPPGTPTCSLDGTPDLHRPDLHPGPDPRGGPVVVGQAPPPRRATSRSSPPPTAGRCGPPTCARAASTTPPPPAPTPTCSTQIAAWVDDGQLGLADLGYEGEADLLRIPIKKPAGGELTVDQQAYNAVHGALRCLGERANSPAQDQLQGAAPLARLPLAHRRRRRRRTGPPPPRTPPHDLIPSHHSP